MSFEIDDILQEIKEKETSNREVTAYLDRHFLDGLIEQYKHHIDCSFSSIFTRELVNINEYNFCGSDFRGLNQKELDIFDFTNCDISSVHLDRVSLEFFLKYFREQSIIFSDLNLEGAYLGPKIYINIKLGIVCYTALNLSDINFSGSNFKNCNLNKVIFNNSNISYAKFNNSKNITPQQFCNSIGFESASFFDNKKHDAIFKKQIVKYSNQVQSAIDKDRGMISKFFLNLF